MRKMDKKKADHIWSRRLSAIVPYAIHFVYQKFGYGDRKRRESSL